MYFRNFERFIQAGKGMSYTSLPSKQLERFSFSFSQAPVPRSSFVPLEINYKQRVYNKVYVHTSLNTLFSEVTTSKPVLQTTRLRPDYIGHGQIQLQSSKDSWTNQ